jgi:hypothetical protein
MPWGTHVCVFCESKEDLLDTVTPFFKAGLESNEFCLWAPSEPLTLEEARTALRHGIPAFDRHLKAGNMEIVPGREWYLDGDQFDLGKIINGWKEKLRGALAKGYDGMRVSGNAFWLGTNHWKSFRDYEYALNKVLQAQQMTVLCTYPTVLRAGLKNLNRTISGVSA